MFRLSANQVKKVSLLVVLFFGLFGFGGVAQGQLKDFPDPDIDLSGLSCCLLKEATIESGTDGISTILRGSSPAEKALDTVGEFKSCRIATTACKTQIVSKRTGRVHRDGLPVLMVSKEERYLCSGPPPIATSLCAPQVNQEKIRRQQNKAALSGEAEEGFETRHWTCAWEWTASIRTEPKCLDLKLGGKTSIEEEARTACYKLCADDNERKECFFTVSRTCTGKDGLDLKGTSRKAKSPFELPADIQSLNQLSGQATPSKLIGQFIKLALSVAGTVALAIFMFGGLTWMSARGNSEKVSKATKTLMWGALGVIVILSSYAIIDFVLDSVAIEEAEIDPLKSIFDKVK